MRNPLNRRAVTAVCEQCSQPFTHRTAWVKRKYCSRACMGKSYRISIEDNYNENVIRHPTGCWGWRLKPNVNGYVQVRSSEGKKMYGHRYSWEVHRGPIPEEMCVLHSCDNPTCTNPDHLFLGTMNDNTKDMLSKDRESRGERHPGARLTEAKVILMRQMYSSGKYTMERLGYLFKVSEGTVYSAVRRQSWKHVP